MYGIYMLGGVVNPFVIVIGPHVPRPKQLKLELDHFCSGNRPNFVLLGYCLAALKARCAATEFLGRGIAR